MKKLLWGTIALLILWLITKILRWDFFLVLSAIVLIGTVCWTIGDTFFEAHERVTSHRRRRDDDDYEIEDD